MKKGNKIFYCSLALSIFVHLLILFEYPSESSDSLIPKAKKGAVSFISFSMNSPEKRLFNSRDRNKREQQYREKTRPKEGSIPLLNKKKNQREKEEKIRGKGAAASSSLSPDVVRNIRETYQTGIRRRIEEMKYYPLAARRMRREGTVRIRFTLARNGSLKSSVLLVKKCGHDILNKAGIKTIILASPFSVFPNELEDEEMTFDVDIDFCRDCGR
ncbi:MAG: energy transducer TonB [bacterium]|nr:energy transducer TonB [bacterium]